MALILCTSSIFYTWSNQRRGASIRAILLDTWKPEYNIQPNASSLAGQILSEEHKAK
jgi:hypothetical protein